MLRRLRKASVPVPHILREFVQDGNRYLVLERIPGRPLISPHRQHPKKVSWRRAEGILKRLGPIFSRMHAAGWVWRDCKPSHILLDRGQFRLIDFEGACLIHQTNALPWGSENYCPRKERENSSRRTGVLEDDYALGVIAFQFGTGKFPPGSSRSRAILYRQTKCPKLLRKKIEDLLGLKT